MKWLQFVAGLLGGGLIVKLLEFTYQEYRRRSDARKTSRHLVDKHIEPIIKAADELVGKIRSLAQSDFKELMKQDIPRDVEFDSWLPFLNVLYLFGQFWCRIEILRIESLSVNLGVDTRGKQLLGFFRALEAKRTRLIERSWQRGIGEALIKETNASLRSLTYIEFVSQFLSSHDFRQWFRPLTMAISQLNHTRERQRLLTYGVILHALIDTLDKKHLVSRDRPGWPNKLTAKTRRQLTFRVFALYLSFVKRPERYFRVRKGNRP